MQIKMCCKLYSDFYFYYYAIRPSYGNVYGEEFFHMTEHHQDEKTEWNNIPLCINMQKNDM